MVIVTMEKGSVMGMANKIIYIAAIILAIVELKAIVFLTWSWFNAKREQEGRDGKRN